MKSNKLILSTLFAGLILFNAQNAIAEFPGQQLLQNYGMKSVTDPKLYGMVAVGFIVCYALYKNTQSRFRGYAESANELLDGLETTENEKKCDQDREEVLQARAKKTGVKKVEPLVENFCKKMSKDKGVVDDSTVIIKKIRSLLFSWGW